MCVVEIEGGPRSAASCTVPSADGMEVRTNTPALLELRRGIMDLLISEHPHGCLTCHRIELCGPSDVCLRHVAVNDRCVTCPKNERCELKDTVRVLGHAHGLLADLQQQASPSESRRPVLGDGHEPVHRVRPLRPRMRRGQGRQRPHAYREVRQVSHRHVSRDLAAGVGVRVLRRVHRRLSYGRSGRAGVQVGQGGRDGDQHLSPVSRRLPDEAGGQQAGQGHPGHARRQRAGEPGPGLFSGASSASTSSTAESASGRRSCGGTARCRRRRGTRR